MGKISSLTFAVLFLVVPGALPQTSSRPATNAQAIGILQQTIAALGNGVPNDSTANGTVSTLAGSRAENGTILIQTRGTSQLLEALQTPSGSTIVYSSGTSGKHRMELVMLQEIENLVCG